MTVDFKAGKGAAYFNILSPGSDETLFVGSSSGDHFKGKYWLMVFIPFECT
jgi:hypothetical protein